MKPFIPGDHLELTDPRGVVLGAVDIDTVEPSRLRLLGTFHPGPGFQPFVALFNTFEEYVEAAALAHLPEIERQIAALGLLIARSGEQGVAVNDVQIYSDGGFSCRPLIPANLNGRPVDGSMVTAATPA